MNTKETFFNPAAVHDYFVQITRRSHPTANQPDVKGNEDPVREYVVDEAGKLENVEVVFYEKDATKPGQRVIVLRRPGSGQFAGQTPVILQAHMDMVYNPVNMKFPLEVVVSPDPPGGKWIKARDSNGEDCTLGADDGIGVATALAILKDNRLKQYPVECLFTLQEETDMGGAQKCDVSHLTGDKLINLDAETLNEIIFGSAGGSETTFKGTIQRQDCPAGYVVRKVSITGLKGGHSGIDINRGRVNAIKVLGQALARLNSRMTQIGVTGDGIRAYDFLVCDIKRDDVIKANAIPAGAEAVIAVHVDQAEPFAIDFNSYCEALKIQSSPVETGFNGAVEEAVSVTRPLDEDSTNLLLSMLQQIPTGVMTMIPGNATVVEASSNFYNVALKGDKLTMALSNRSSSEKVLKAVNKLQKNIGRCFGFKVKTGANRYPSWEPVHTQLLKDAERVYADLFKGDYEVTVVHAGLECGVLAARFQKELDRELQAVSIGPNIRDPHTPRESLEIESPDGAETVQPFYDAVSKIIETVFG